MTKIRKCLPILLLVPLFGAGCGGHDTEAKSSQAVNAAGEVFVPVAQQEGYIESQSVRASEVPDVIRVPGRIVLPDNGTWRVGAITSGRIEEVLASQGDYVRAGQVLARMHSHDVHEAVAAYLTAVAERSRSQSAEVTAHTNYDRMQRLYALKAASLEQTELAKQQWVDAQTAQRSADIALERERAHLEDNLGIPIKGDPQGEDKDIDELIPIRAPASGYVLQRNVTPGTVVELSADLFVIGDLRRLWLTASVNEEYLDKLRTGRTATIFVNGLPNVSIEGRLTDVGQQFDPTTHMMRVRIEFENPNDRLRPEMLAEAQIPIGTAKSGLLVPADAVQQVDGQDAVFVQTSADRFTVRSVVTGAPVRDQVPITEGLMPGERVVTHGAFLLKSELLKSSLPSD